MVDGQKVFDVLNIWCNSERLRDTINTMSERAFNQKDLSEKNGTGTIESVVFPPLF